MGLDEGYREEVAVQSRERAALQEARWGRNRPLCLRRGEPATRGYIGGLALVAVHARNRDYATSSRPLGPFWGGERFGEVLTANADMLTRQARVGGTSRRLFLLDRPVQDWIELADRRVAGPPPGPPAGSAGRPPAARQALL